MLERKGNDVLDPLDGYGQRVAREPFTDDKLDSAEVIGRAPVILLEEFLLKDGEFESLQFAVLGKIYCNVRTLPRKNGVIVPILPKL